MVQLWCVIGLALAAVSVSTLGAAFSIMGLGKLFAGAMVAVWLMAGSLELAKFVIAAFLHQVWGRLHFLFKTYLLLAVVVLSGITSMGIFGFLSSAYQTSSTTLESEQIRLEATKAETERDTNEVARLQKMIDDIPASRVTKKMAARAEAEPLIQNLRKELDRLAKESTAASLRILDVKEKVGPLIYIARAFHEDVDTVVKYLILVFVSVFDPLAICLVIAVSESFKIRAQMKNEPKAETAATAAPSTEVVAAGPVIEMRFSNEASAVQPASAEAEAEAPPENPGEAAA